MRFMILVCSLLLFTPENQYAEPIKTPQHVFSSLNQRIANHKGQYPFPTDMTFRAFANHTIDQCTNFFDPSTVKKGDTIYLADFYISWFVKYVHPRIEHPYIIISNDSDSSHPDPGIWDYNEANGWPLAIDATRTLLYDPKVAAWFCKNMVISKHPKIVQIPIGQQIIYWNTPLFQKNLITAMEEKPEKQHLLYMNMQLASHPVRPVLFSLFENKPYCMTKGSTILTTFYSNLSSSMFVLAPPGYGPDTVRFWEAIALNCIPIVEHSDLDDLYDDLPALFVYDWKEINEDLLIEEYAKIKKTKNNKDKAFFDYWAKKIENYQAKIKKEPDVFSSLSKTKFPTKTLITLITLLKTHTTPQDSLLCIGSVLGLRPFEIAKNTKFKNIFVQDPWGAWSHEKADAHLSPYENRSLLKFSKKITPITYYENPYALIPSDTMNKTHIFLDITYRRHSAISLLDEAYKNAARGTLIIGTLGKDPFIKEMIMRFEKKTNTPISSTGELWYLIKK